MQTQGNQNRVAVITGAASGIGAAFSVRLAADGWDLVLVDRDVTALDALLDSLRGFSSGVQSLVCDLSTPAGIDQCTERLAQEDSVELLINNAGIGMGGKFIDQDVAAQTDMINLHAMATTRICRAVLPNMVRRDSGAIINVSSLGIFQREANDILYRATKKFLHHFSRCLSSELSDTNIRVQALCPGYTRTEFHKSEYFKGGGNAPAMLWMSPEEVAAASLKGLKKNKVTLVPGLANRILRFIIPFPRILSLVMFCLAAPGRLRTPRDQQAGADSGDP